MQPELDPQTRLRLQILAREQLKLKLLTDLTIDIEICKLEGWSIKDYILELQELINSFLWPPST
jgi:hypothetical protein